MKTVLALSVAFLGFLLIPVFTGEAESKTIPIFSTMHGHTSPVCNANDPQPDCSVWINECDRAIRDHHCIIVPRKMNGDDLMKFLLENHGISSTKVIGWTEEELRPIEKKTVSVTPYCDHWWQQGWCGRARPGQDEDRPERSEARTETQPSEPPARDVPERSEPPTRNDPPANCDGTE